MNLSDKINSLAGLEDNWDGRGSAKPSKAALDTVKSLGIIPLGNGGVQLELRIDDVEVEIEIDEHGKIVSVYWSEWSY